MDERDAGLDEREDERKDRKFNEIGVAGRDDDVKICERLEELAEHVGNHSSRIHDGKGASSKGKHQKPRVTSTNLLTRRPSTHI
ncbi:Hypothetical predicted protein [Octopus vulgaris]|uniref:Uncharacterized protein n=1 Tax=Octopus vulgaris TaxID=6645 RepID=A0AA36ARJ4_OCTVU|nr:Hypothetical predicted protein [Octopus vulgaris]